MKKLSNKEIEDVISTSNVVPLQVDKKVESNKPAKTSMKTTKDKVVRTYTRDVVDQSTGEIETQTVIEAQTNQDFGWEKAWILNLFLAFQELGSKKVEVAMWLLKNKNRDNQIVYSQREVAELTGISIKTVNETFKLLLGCDAIRRRNNKSISMWNPNIISYGSTVKRDKLIIEFGRMPSEEKSNGKK